MTADWRQNGACKSWDPEVFFTSGPPGRALEDLCRACPSLIPCTFDALRRGDCGYQAGLQVAQRHAIRRWDRAAKKRVASQASRAKANQS